MWGDMMEALLKYYKDDVDVVVDILLWLHDIINKGDKHICADINQMLSDLGRCIYCGEKMQSTVIKNIHTELDGNVVEYESVDFCPVCDIKLRKGVKYGR